MKIVYTFVLSFLINSIFAQVEFSSSNLPIIKINTFGSEIVDEPKIDAQMDIIHNGDDSTNSIDDYANVFSGKIGIEIRGWSSQQRFPKKQYAFETRKSDGENLNVSLLGLPSENDWILSAPYSDKTLMRNVLAYKIANDLGGYASRTKFCELVLNDEYMGVFVLMEKIKRDNNRVNIKKLTENDIDGVDLTGGYIIRIDKDTLSNELNGFYSEYLPYDNAWQKIYYQYYYPSDDDILPIQREYIYDHMNRFETVLNSKDYNEIFGGVYDYIDINSFVDYFIVNEIGRNIDSYRLSTYLYKDRNDVDSTLKAGPVWDMNLAFGNARYNDGEKDFGWQVDYSGTSRYQNPFWISKLFHDPLVFNKISQRWRNLRAGKLHVDSLIQYIESTAAYLNEAQERNFKRWPVLDTYVWPNFFIGENYREELDFLEDWLTKRIDWMDSQLDSSQTNSLVVWKEPDSSSVQITPNKEHLLPLSYFIDDYSEIDLIKFYSKDPDLRVWHYEDSVVLESSIEGKYIIKGTGWYRNELVELSKEYIVDVGSITSIETSEAEITGFSLAQNYPNPFNPTTTIKFNIPVPSDYQSGQTILRIFNTLGEQVAELLNQELGSGVHTVQFNASNLSGGIYFYELTAGKYRQIRKMILLK
ncbi:MAG: CotH kinase family protein [Melioribacteraceae bacterium]|nr:CotH kinase family protein [Melioribacteraceae bacterium]